MVAIRAKKLATLAEGWAICLAIVYKERSAITAVELVILVRIAPRLKSALVIIAVLKDISRATAQESMPLPKDVRDT